MRKILCAVILCALCVVAIPAHGQVVDVDILQFQDMVSDSLDTATAALDSTNVTDGSISGADLVAPLRLPGTIYSPDSLVFSRNDIPAIIIGHPTGSAVSYAKVFEVRRPDGGSGTPWIYMDTNGHIYANGLNTNDIIANNGVSQFWKLRTLDNDRYQPTIPAIHAENDTDTGIEWETTASNRLLLMAKGGTVAVADSAGFHVVGNIDASGSVSGAMPIYTVISDSVLTAAQTMQGLWYARPLDAKYTLTLPTAVAGQTVEFMVADADSLLITAASGDSLITEAGAAWKTTSSVGGTVKLICVDTVRWIMQYTTGTWTSY